MIALTKTSETTSKISFSWHPVPGAVGYVFFADDKRVSNTWDPSRGSVTFGKVPGGRYRVDAVGVEDSGSWPPVADPPPPPPPPPPPGTGTASPVAHFNNGVPGYWPPSNIDKYGLSQAAAPAPVGFTGVHILYRTGITCSDRVTNITEQVCIANRWEMRGVDGTPLRNSGYGGVLADPGLPAYQDAWFAESLRKVREIGATGIWIDDVSPRLWAIAGRTSPKYPDDASYENAIAGALARWKQLADENGLRLAVNSAIPSDDDTSRTSGWLRRIAPSINWFTVEGWLTPFGPTNRFRLRGPGWDQNWDLWRGVHRLCNELGVGFYPINFDRGAQVYGLGTFLLDHDARFGGAYIWHPDDSYVVRSDTWVPQYTAAVNLGAPTGPPVESGGIVTRQFANGRVTVDPVAGTASIAG